MERSPWLRALLPALIALPQLALPTEAPAEYRERIAAVTAVDPRWLGGDSVSSERAAVAVPGDPGELQPMTLRYRVLLQGNPFGIATTELSAEDEIWTASTTIQAGPVTQTSEVRFRSDFTPISLRSTLPQGGREFGAELMQEGGRVTGTVRLPPQMGGERTLDTRVPKGTLFSGMDAFALAAARIAVGETVAFPLLTEQTGEVVRATFEVKAEESITVPAGTFEAFRVEMTAGPQSGTLWLRREAPHLVLRQVFVGQPVVIELEGL